MQAPIVPFTISTAGLSGSAVQINVSNQGQVNTSSQSLRFQYNLTDSKGTVLQGGTAQLTAAQYAAWVPGQNDNAYFCGCIAANLGLTIAPASSSSAPAPAAAASS